jgi:hypothetical protein
MCVWLRSGDDAWRYALAGLLGHEHEAAASNGNLSVQKETSWLAGARVLRVPGGDTMMGGKYAAS